MNVRVGQGKIHVNSVTRLVEYKHAFVALVDCRAKYPMIAGVSGSAVYLFAGENTLHAEESDSATEVQFLDLDGNWHLDATAGRYEVYVYGWRVGQPTDYEEVWTDDELG